MKTKIEGSGIFNGRVETTTCYADSDYRKLSKEKISIPTEISDDLGVIADAAYFRAERIADIEALLRELKREQAYEIDVVLPAYMDALGVDNLELCVSDTDAIRVAIRTEYHGSIPSDYDEARMLIESTPGYEGKTQVYTALKIHPMTLKKFIRENIEGGNGRVVESVLGAYQGFKAKVELKKRNQS